MSIVRRNLVIYRDLMISFLFIFLLINLIYNIKEKNSFDVKSRKCNHLLYNNAINNGHRFYNRTYPLSKPSFNINYITYRIALVSDLDTKSKSLNDKIWNSNLLKGYLIYYPFEKIIKFDWDDNLVNLNTKIASSGRGSELSELIVFNGKLYTCDDRTGIVYEIINEKKLVPWIILNDGNGKINKGFKCEWITVKNDYMIVGGLGKEWTDNNNKIINFNPQWIKNVSTSGEIEHVYWRENYLKLSSALNIQYPGYVIHESCMWSNIHQKWFFLPRRASNMPYNEIDDELRGTNLLMIADENFESITIKEIGEKIASRGFSSFKFVPGTNDMIILAIKSEELNGFTSTFITVFTINGEILLEDRRVQNSIKYEGIEFI